RYLSACRRGVASRSHRFGSPFDRRTRSHRDAFDTTGVARAVRVGRRRPDRNRPRRSRVTLDYGLDTDVITPPESLAAAIRRRVGGRYVVDPFGLDPQLCDIVAPAVGACVRVQVEHPERIPTTGPAALVSNRGGGIGE